MLRLATVDNPDVLCVQEVPAWALGKFTVGDIAARPVLGPLPIPRRLGRFLTDPHHGLFRSAFSGQGNAMIIGGTLRLVGHRVLTLNTRRFRDAQARAMELSPVARLAWAKERRGSPSPRAAPRGRPADPPPNHHRPRSPPAAR